MKYEKNKNKITFYIFDIFDITHATIPAAREHKMKPQMVSCTAILRVQSANIKCAVKSNVAYATKPNIPPHLQESRIRVFQDEVRMFGTARTAIPIARAIYTNIAL
jgi:hypothetical protein